MRRSILVLLAFVLLLTVPQAQGDVVVANYLWYFPYVSPATTNAPTLVERLRVEIQKVLDAGNGLGIAYYAHSDGAQSSLSNQFWIYLKPGRIITTLAWAYPYLTAAQQTAVRAYVATELADATFHPWGAQLTPTSSSVYRELFPHTTRTFVNYSNFSTTQPALEQLYGLWLYGWQIGGDWSALTAYHGAIDTWYTNIFAQGNVYGSMGGLIAKARLEHTNIWNNTAHRDTAIGHLQAAMNTGRTFSTVEGYVQTSPGYWSYQYGSSRKQSGQYLGWMFYGISPEIARYLSSSGENVTAALTRHASGKTKYPYWWLRQAAYTTSATGMDTDTEAIGLSPENICMIAPMERYAVGASSATMQTYAKSGPVVIGDSCWIELLVYAIESTGTLQWVDVRNGHP